MFSLVLLAGGTAGTALPLAVAMLGFQFATGALNDLFDAPADARSKPSKPIPSGLIGPRAALAVGATSGLVGVVLSARFGPAVLVVGILILLAGLAYDAFLKRAGLGWLAFAVEFPLVPAYAWLAARGSLPQGYAVLFPAAMALGLALNLANGLVDEDTDRVGGVRSAVVRLGAPTALVLLAVAHAGVLAAAWVTLFAFGGASLIPAILLGVATAFVAMGVSLSASSSSARREQGWDLQVLAAGLLATGWLLGVAI